jgi:hypothetical protein
VNAAANYSITQKIYATNDELKEAASHIALNNFSDYFEDWSQQRWMNYFDTTIEAKV